MHKRTRFAKTITITIAAAFIISAVVFVFDFRIQEKISDVLGIIWCGGISPCSNTTEPAVTITGFIRIGEINFKVYPEKRIPAINNWQTVSDVTIENCSTNATFTFNGIPTDNLGDGTITVPNGQIIPDGNYRFFVHGLSHLNEEFNCYSLSPGTNNIDLTVEGKYLLAGEVSVIYDNYINSLDTSVLINQLFTANNKNDLNQDGEVNSLDLGNQIYNFYTAGD